MCCSIEKKVYLISFDIPIVSTDWTEKYRPKSLADVIGNPKAVSELQSWAKQWLNGSPRYKAVVLMGSPGVGKTTSAEALARDMGWDIIEMNSSDQRTEAAIRETALRGAFSNSFSSDGTFISTKEGRLKLIVLDEADGLFGNADKGGLSAIGELIRKTQQPVILIVNDFYEISRKSSIVKAETLQITFQRPTAVSIGNALKRICRSEGITADDAVIKRLAENASGDMRAAVRDLESISMGRDALTIDDASELSNRIASKSIYDLMFAVFRKYDPMGARDLMERVDEDPDTVLLWADENLPYEYRDPGDLIRGYERLSRADIFLRKIPSYAKDMMTAGVASARKSSVINRERVKKPSITTKLRRTRGIRATKKSLCQKLAVLTHSTSKRVSMDVLDPMRSLFKNDPELRVAVTYGAELEEDEVGFLMGEESDSKIVKSILAEAKAYIPPEGSIETVKGVFGCEEDDDPPYYVPSAIRSAPPAESDSQDVEPVSEPVPESSPEKVKTKGQTSLFDF